MPTLLHEALIEMVRDRPALVAELLADQLGVTVPRFRSARLSAAEMTNVKPTAFYADAVVTLANGDEPVLGVVVEVQLRPAEQKRRSWPVYVSTLYARLGCPVVLLVVSPDKRTADWAAQPIKVGEPGMVLTPVVLGPRQIPVITDSEAAVRHPELTVLSALAHADRDDPKPVLEALLAALDTVDDDHVALYTDLVLQTLSEAARKSLEELMTISLDRFKSDFFRRMIAEARAEARAEVKAEGRAEGLSEGRAAGQAEALVGSILTVLEARHIDVPDDARTTVTGCTDLGQLDVWLRRAATVDSIDDLFA